MRIFIFGSCRVCHLAYTELEFPGCTIYANIAHTYTTKEILQYLDFYENPNLVKDIARPELVFESYQDPVVNINAKKPDLDEAEFFIVEISTLRIWKKNGYYLCPSAIHWTLCAGVPLGEHDTEIMTLQECYSEIQEFHRRVGYRPTIFLFPAKPTNRLSLDAAIAEEEIHNYCRNNPHPLYFYDINQVVGKPKDFRPLDDDAVIGPEFYHLFGGEKRIDWNHYSELGKQKSALGLMTAIYKIAGMYPDLTLDSE